MPKTAEGLPIVLFIFLIGIALNHIGWNKVSRIAMSLCFPVVVTFLSIFEKSFGPSEIVHYIAPIATISASITVPMALFTWQEKKIIIPVLIIHLSIQLLQYPVHEAFGVGIENSLHEFTNFIPMYTTMILATFAAWLGLYSFLMQVNNRFELDNSRLIQELKGNNIELSQKNKDLTQFSHIVSHDLKTPVRGISSLASFLEEDIGGHLEEIPPNVKSSLDLLKSRAIRMEALIDGILSYSKAGTNLNHQAVQLDKLVKELLQEMKLPDAATVKVANPLPALQANPTEFYQLFQNLISNAIKHNDSDKPEVTITIQIGASNFTIFVTDNGPGIATRYHHKVFQMFQTANDEQVIENSGIGLPIVKKIIERYSGTIHLDSSVGRGTTFIITLPNELLIMQ